MKPIFVGIAGGSGVGKTTLAEELRSRNPDNTSLLHLDDFQIFDTPPPLLNGFPNWEDPGYIDWIRLVEVLRKLGKGESVSIAHREQQYLENVTNVALVPTEVIVVEGYLLFYAAVVRKLLDVLVYLDASPETRIQRRTKFKDARYVSQVLLPMHNAYIEPTRAFATHSINTGTTSLEASAVLVEEMIALVKKT